MKRMMVVILRGFDAKISKWAASYINQEIPSNLVAASRHSILRARAFLLNVIPSEADYRVWFLTQGTRRQREQHYASHYHWIQLLFYSGLLAKLIKTGQQCSLVVTSSHQKGTRIFLCQTLCWMSLIYIYIFFSSSHILEQVVAAVMPRGDCDSWIPPVFTPLTKKHTFPWSSPPAWANLVPSRNGIQGKQMVRHHKNSI